MATKLHVFLKYLCCSRKPPQCPSANSNMTKCSLNLVYNVFTKDNNILWKGNGEKVTVHLATVYVLSTAVNIWLCIYRKPREHTQISAQTERALHSATSQQEDGPRWRPCPHHLSHTASPLKEKAEVHSKVRTRLTIAISKGMVWDCAKRKGWEPLQTIIFHKAAMPGSEQPEANKQFGWFHRQILLRENSQETLK